jgi:hypothetical protein
MMYIAVEHLPSWADDRANEDSGIQILKQLDPLLCRLYFGSFSSKPLVGYVCHDAMRSAKGG